MTNDGLRQATVRASTGTALTYEGDWHALFDAAGIAAGPFDGRMLAWINAQLSASYVEVNGAMEAFAISQGAPNWVSMGSFTIGGAAFSPRLDFADARDSQYLAFLFGGGVVTSPSVDFSQASNSMYVPALAA